MNSFENSGSNGAEQLGMACAALKKMTRTVGKERAFLEVQASWPMMTRETLEKMLAYGKRPTDSALQELMSLFANAMSHS